MQADMTDTITAAQHARQEKRQQVNPHSFEKPQPAKQSCEGTDCEVALDPWVIWRKEQRYSRRLARWREGQPILSLKKEVEISRSIEAKDYRQAFIGEEKSNDWTIVLLQLSRQEALITKHCGKLPQTEGRKS